MAGVTHTVRIVESNSAVPRVYTTASKTSALRLAHNIVGGCLKGEGYVQVYKGDYTADRRVVDADPIKVFRA